MLTAGWLVVSLCGAAEEASAQAVAGSLRTPEPDLESRTKIVMPAVDAWVGEDKLQHFTLSFALTDLGYGAARWAGLDRREAMVSAAAAAVAAGLWKEWYDRRRGRPFSLRDLAWDLAGVGLGILWVEQLQ